MQLGLNTEQSCNIERTVEELKYIPSLHRLSIPRPRMMFLWTSSGIDGLKGSPESSVPKSECETREGPTTQSRSWFKTGSSTSVESCGNTLAKEPRSGISRKETEKPA